MILSTGDMIAIIIALGANLILMFIITYANISLLKQNRFLRSRLQALRRSRLQLNPED